MKLIHLFERVNHAVVIDRADLIAIKNAFEKTHDELFQNCFSRAVAEAIRIMTGITVQQHEIDILAGAKARSERGTSRNVHPDDLVHVYAQGVPHHGEMLALDLSYDFVNSHDELKGKMRQGVPVILSLAWHDYFYWPRAYMRDHSQSKLETYKHAGATPEMIARAKQGIVPAPNAKVLNNSRTGRERHAVNCVGYDAGQKAYICRDFLGGMFKGYFKLDEKLIFSSKLKEAGQPLVEAAIAIQVDKKRLSRSAV